MQTGKNEVFLRLWWEIGIQSTALYCVSQDEFNFSRAKWAPYNKGGAYRKWFGNFDYLIDWESEGEAISRYSARYGTSIAFLPKSYRFKPSITWSIISSGAPAFRFRPAGSLHDIGGMSCFPQTEHRMIILGFYNSTVARSMLQILSPTMNNQAGDIGKLPLLLNQVEDVKDSIIAHVETSVLQSILDWNLSEISWQFKRNALV